MSARILIVEDEPDIAALLAYHLARAGYQVQTASDGHAALRALQTEVPHLIVLDLMLPGLAGTEVLRELRGPNGTTRVPVIVVTARSDERERVCGLNRGADDYITKPFSPDEVVARVGAVLRRAEQPGLAEAVGRVLRVGPFTLDLGATRAEVDGEELVLTPTEFRLLHALMERRGRVQDRRRLLEAVWGITADIHTRTVDVHMQRLRTKLGERAHWLETVRGFGYRLRADPSA